MLTPWFTSASEGANLAAALSKDQKCAINMDARQEKEEKNADILQSLDSSCI